MKNYLPLLLVGLMLLAGCTITDPSTDLEVRITMPGTGAVVGGQITDSFGRMITSPVTLTITGQDASYIVDLLNEPLTTLTTSSGFVVMAVNDTIDITEDAPVRFSIQAVANGYLPQIVNLELNSPNGTQFEMRMVGASIDNLPPGLVGAEEEVGTDPSGAIVNAVNIASPAHAGTGASSSLSVPAGARFLDSDGNPLTGNVNVLFIYGDLESSTIDENDTTETASIDNLNGGDDGEDYPDDYFPGGLENAETPDGDDFVPISFYNLVAVDANGRVAVGMDSPVQFRAVVPASAYNPNTDTTYMVGDTIAFFTIDDQGLWIEGVGAVLEGPDNNGNLFAIFDLSNNSIFHGKSDRGFEISSHNNGGGGAFGKRGDRRGEKIDFYFKWQEARDRRFVVQLISKDLKPKIRILQGYHNSKHRLKFRRDYERIKKLKLTIYDPNGGIWRTVSVPRNRNEYNLTGTAWPWPDAKNVTAHIFAKMPPGRDPSEIRTSGLYVQIADAADTSSWTPVGSVQRGIITLPGLQVNHAYYLKGTYTFRGQTRTANTPWTRQITATTDTLQYWYQLSNDEADEYEDNG